MLFPKQVHGKFLLVRNTLIHLSKFLEMQVSMLLSGDAEFRAYFHICSFTSLTSANLWWKKWMLREVRQLLQGWTRSKWQGGSLTGIFSLFHSSWKLEQGFWDKQGTHSHSLLCARTSCISIWTDTPNLLTVWFSSRKGNTRGRLFTTKKIRGKQVSLQAAHRWWCLDSSFPLLAKCFAFMLQKACKISNIREVFMARFFEQFHLTNIPSVHLWSVKYHGRGWGWGYQKGLSQTPASELFPVSQETLVGCKQHLEHEAEEVSAISGWKIECCVSQRWENSF